MARRSDMDRAADALYAKVPEVNCKGHCKASCGPIDMSHRERSRIHQETGVSIPTSSQMLRSGGSLTCPALSEEGRCDAYEIRPMICRVWGSSEDLKCRWGCQPAEGQRLLTGAETYRLLGAAMDAGGGCPDRNITAAAVAKKLAKHGDNAFSAPAGRAYIQRGENADYYREATQAIPASFVSTQIIKRYADAHTALAKAKDTQPYA